jgi:hypothetical protein
MFLVIISCPKLSHRLPAQIERLNTAILAGLISGLYIISMNDEELKSQVSIQYRQDKWASDIVDGWDFFLENIVLARGSMDSVLAISSKGLSPNSFFPFRELSQGEHSVALRHILAMQIAARQNCPCLILEDDALICDQVLFFQLLRNLRLYCKPRVFYDLCDDFVPLDHNASKHFRLGVLQFHVKTIAITRTLLAYAIAPETAGMLLASFAHYSLPIDMQLQVLLARMCMPGLCLVNSPFAHGSKNGTFLSSI